MFQRSWQLALLPARRGSAIIPQGSFSESIIAELPRGTLWLCWRRTRNSARLNQATAPLRKLSAAVQEFVLPREVEHDRCEISQHDDDTLVAQDAVPTASVGDSSGQWTDFVVTVAQLASVVQSAAAQYGFVSTGNAKSLPMQQIPVTLNDVSNAYMLATKAANQLEKSIPKNLENALSALTGVYNASNRRASARPAALLNSPLAHLVQSWQKMYEELTHSLLEQLSATSELPLDSIRRILDKLQK